MPVKPPEGFEGKRLAVSKLVFYAQSTIWLYQGDIVSGRDDDCLFGLLQIKYHNFGAFLCVSVFFFVFFGGGLCVFLFRGWGGGYGGGGGSHHNYVFLFSYFHLTAEHV